jgi:hypothetical protein
MTVISFFLPYSFTKCAKGWSARRKSGLFQLNNAIVGENPDFPVIFRDPISSCGIF